MQTYAPADILCGAYLTPTYLPDVIAEMCNRLTPDNMILSVVSRAFKDKTDLTEKWYGTEYVRLLASPLSFCALSPH